MVNGKSVGRLGVNSGTAGSSEGFDTGRCVTYTHPDLPIGDYTASIDTLIIDSWDGANGPDTLFVKIDGDPDLRFKHIFSNVVGDSARMQSYVYGACTRYDQVDANSTYCQNCESSCSVPTAPESAQYAGMSSYLFENFAGTNYTDAYYPLSVPFTQPTSGPLTMHICADTLGSNTLDDESFAIKGMTLYQRGSTGSATVYKSDFDQSTAYWSLSRIGLIGKYTSLGYTGGWTGGTNFLYASAPAFPTPSTANPTASYYDNCSYSTSCTGGAYGDGRGSINGANPNYCDRTPVPIPPAVNPHSGKWFYNISCTQHDWLTVSASDPAATITIAPGRRTTEVDSNGNPGYAVVDTAYPTHPGGGRMWVNYDPIAAYAPLATPASFPADMRTNRFKAGTTEILGPFHIGTRPLYPGLYIGGLPEGDYMLEFELYAFDAWNPGAGQNSFQVLINGNPVANSLRSDLPLGAGGSSLGGTLLFDALPDQNIAMDSWSPSSSASPWRDLLFQYQLSFHQGSAVKFGDPPPPLYIEFKDAGKAWMLQSAWGIDNLTLRRAINADSDVSCGIRYRFADSGGSAADYCLRFKPVMNCNVGTCGCTAHPMNDIFGSFLALPKDSTQCP